MSKEIINSLHYSSIAEVKDVFNCPILIVGSTLNLNFKLNLTPTIKDQKFSLLHYTQDNITRGQWKAATPTP